MKKIIFIIFLVLSVSNAADSNLNLAMRYIKLGTTYREGKDFDKAAKYINQGLTIARKYKNFDGKYWTASAYENLGYLYRDMAMYDESRSNFAKALFLFKQIIKQEDGSQEAILSVMNKIVSLNSAELPLQNNYISSADNVLNLSAKKLKELPDDIPQNVKSLILKDNRFRNYPDAVNQYRNLEYLDFSDNRLRNLPDGIGNLTNLHFLDLSNNKINEIPPTIANLRNLRELNLEGNKLKTLNFNLCALKNLQILNIRNNKIDFQEVLKLVRCLPNTNILFDKYEKIDEPQDAETGVEEL